MEIPFVEYEEQHNKLGTGNDQMWSNGEYNLAQKIIKRDDVVFDIGANHGNWSKMILSLAPLKKIYCCEPIPDLCQYISQQHHFRKELRIVNGAVTDQVGETTFYVYRNNPQVAEMSNLFRRPDVERENKIDVFPLQVKTITVDHLCEIEKVEQIDFMKVDTEGAEMLVLKGAKQTLEKGILKKIQFEYGGCYQDSKTTLKEVCEYLSGYGFILFRIIPNGLMHMGLRWRNEYENYLHSNYFATLEVEQFLPMQFQAEIAPIKRKRHKPKSLTISENSGSIIEIKEQIPENIQSNKE